MKPQGFTFVELMVTLAILGVLLLAVIPTVQIAARRGQEQQLRTALFEIRTAIDAYKRAVDLGRIRVGVGDSGYPPSLEVLVEGVPDMRSPDKKVIYFLRRLPRDPFATSSDEDASESWVQRSYASPPDSPEEGEDVFDVFSASTRVGLNGVPYNEW